MANKYGKKGSQKNLLGKSLNPDIKKASIKDTITKAQAYNKGMNVKLTKAQKTYAKRIKDIPNITNFELKIAYFTTYSKMMKGRIAGKKLQNRRIRSYEKKTGKKASRMEKKALKYMTAGELIKGQGIEGITNPKIKTDTTATTQAKKQVQEEAGATVSITNANLGYITWDDIPEDIRKGSRDKDSFLYRNRELLWDSDVIDLNDMLKEGTDGNDLTLKGFLEQTYGEDNLNTLFAYGDDDTLQAVEYSYIGDLSKGIEGIISGEGISEKIINTIVSIISNLGV